MEYKILENIKNGLDIKTLKPYELIRLSHEIRQKIIETVAKNGGHLASNLGVVELTLALHLSFQFPKDQIVFDVSHQSYTHKLLSGRIDEFDTLRTYKGLSGYCKISESDYDAFGAGHASTSISSALGLKTAGEFSGEKRNVIALIGDGAMSGGLAFEALNSLGNMKQKLIVIINDNEQSISKNVGALSSVLNNLRTSKKYIKIKGDVRRQLPKIPLVGIGIKNFMSKTKNMLKQGLVEGMFFEELGLTYIGIIDGHDIGQMRHIFESIKHLDVPVVIHVVTKKGKGYLPATKDPAEYHGVGRFDLKKGIEQKELCDYSKLSFSELFGRKILDLAERDERLLAITAAMDKGTGLEYFKTKFPNRFFDVGIAESHAMTFSAGLARNGMKPYFAVYSTFLQRAYDQLVHDVCLQKLPVRICLDRCGLVGEDGPTHHGVFDLQMLLGIPNLEVLSPSTGEELEYCMDYSLEAKGPLCIRYPRKTAPHSELPSSLEPMLYGENEAEITVISFGHFSDLAISLSEKLRESGRSTNVLKLLRLKPLKASDLSFCLKKTKLVVSIEDGQMIGGFSSYLQMLLQEEDLKLRFYSFGYPDSFVEHGSIKQLDGALGFDVEMMAEKIACIHL